MAVFEGKVWTRELQSWFVEAADLADAYRVLESGSGANHLTWRDEHGTRSVEIQSVHCVDDDPDADKFLSLRRMAKESLVELQSD